MKQIYSVFILLMIGACVFCQSSTKEYLGFLTAEEQTKLIQSGSFTTFGATAQELRLWKKSPFADIVQRAIGENKSSIASESLFLLERPAAVSRADIDAKIFKAFTSFTAMKGLLAYSESKKGMETFIFDSYRVDSLTDKRPLPDPEASSIPAHVEYTLYQREEQFKNVYSRYSFDMGDSWYAVSLVNLTPLRFLLVTLVPPEQLHTTFVIIPLNDALLVYGITIANTPRLFGLERSKESSFSNRMKALISWFSTNLTNH